MFDHVKFGVSDYAASKAFFLKALEPLGVAVVAEGAPTYGIELAPTARFHCACSRPTEKPAHLHLAFKAGIAQQVEAFHRAALEAGGKDNGAPGLRPHYHANYFAASSSVRTGTTSRRSATSPRPDPSEGAIPATRLATALRRPYDGTLVRCGISLTNIERKIAR